MFKSIAWQNFQSWKAGYFEFRPGVTLLEGFNYDDNTSEGAGKSAVPNALSWCVTGFIPKDVNTDDVIREGEKGCSVAVELENDCTIVRTRGPNDYYILDQNGRKVKGKDAKETQRIVENMIGMSFDTFCQSVYFAQNYPKKFITATEAEKAKILSELQNLEQFDLAGKKAGDMIKVLDTDLLKVQNDKKVIETLITSESVHLSRMEVLKEKEAEEREVQRQSLIETVEIALSDLATVTEELEAIELIDTSVEKQQLTELIEQKNNIQVDILSDNLNQRKQAEKRIIALKAEIDGYKDELKNAKLGSECTACGTTINDPKKFEAKKESLKKSILAKQASLNEEQAELNKLVPKDTAKLKADMASISVVIAQIQEIIANAEKVRSHKQSIEMKLKMLTEQYNSASSKLKAFEAKPVNTSKYDNEIESLKESIGTNQEKLEALNKTINENSLKASKLKVLKDGYKEVKSHVFKGLLADLTAKTNRFLEELFEIPVRIEFDNTSENGDISKITSRVVIDGHDRSMGLLSGGQFRRVQLAVDFALSSIVSNRASKSINLRILDEPFKDLSESSMEKIVRLLERMEGSTVIIEHNSIIKSIVNNVYRIELRDGISKEVDSF